MKKTLILIALSCGSLASAIDYQAYLDLVLAQQGYVQGGDFTFVLDQFKAVDTSTPHQATFITLAPDINLRTQTNGNDNKAYVGFSPTAGDPGTMNLTRTVTDSPALDSYTYTFSATETTGPNGWITRNGTTATASTAPRDFTNATVTVSYVADTLTTTIDFDFGSGVTPLQATIVGREIADAHAITIGSQVTCHLPEPATATLSLLALAGLAARRRRH